jgi:hypothetical protein
MNLFESILMALADPNIAYILFTLGSIGLIAELYNPGSIFPGVTGAICLILAFTAFGSLPSTGPEYSCCSSRWGFSRQKRLCPASAFCGRRPHRICARLGDAVHTHYTADARCAGRARQSTAYHRHYDRDLSVFPGHRARCNEDAAFTGHDRHRSSYRPERTSPFGAVAFDYGAGAPGQRSVERAVGRELIAAQEEVQVVKVEGVTLYVSRPETERQTLI